MEDRITLYIIIALFLAAIAFALIRGDRIKTTEQLQLDIDINELHKMNDYRLFQYKTVKKIIKQRKDFDKSMLKELDSAFFKIPHTDRYIEFDPFRFLRPDEEWTYNEMMRS